MSEAYYRITTRAHLQHECTVNFEMILIIACAYLVAAFVKGATGLGFSTSALPILALGLGLKSAMPLVIIPSLVSNAIVMMQATSPHLQ